MLYFILPGLFVWFHGYMVLVTIQKYLSNVINGIF